MRIQLKSFFFVLLITLCFKGYSQRKELNYNLQSTFVTGTGNSTAFWSVSNQFGTISVQPHSVMLRTGLFVPFDSGHRKGIDYALGLDLLNRFDGNYNFFMQQYYLKLKAGVFTFQGGRIEEVFGNQDSTLSSGGLLWSGNAPPMPKITAGILNYVPVPFTHGYLEIKGAIAHGWFGKDSYVKQEWLHHKYIYFRAGGDLPVNLSFGFHHYVQWGGVSPTDGKLPSSLKDFWIIFTAKQIDTTGLSRASTGLESEFSNRIGNHLGVRDFGLDIKFKRFLTGLYFQSYFEDNASLHWHNLPDGLYGFYIKPKENKWLTKLVCEIVSTTNQAKPYRAHTMYPGDDNTFNNYVYKSGWTYNNYTLGTPFITTPEMFNKINIPVSLQRDYLKNNRIQALYLGAEGITKVADYRIKLCFIRNFGTYYFPMPIKTSFSTFLELKKQIRWCGGVQISGTMTNDYGTMYGNKTSVEFTLRKYGKFL